MDAFASVIEIADVIGLIGTIVGFLSWLYERQRRRKLELEAKRRIWSDISKVTGLMSDLEKDLSDHGKSNGSLQAVGKLSIMFRDLLKEASLKERGYSLATVVRWRKIGKLASDWQEKVALMLLSDAEIDDDLLNEQFQQYANWDALPDDHPAHAQDYASRRSRLADPLIHPDSE